MFFQTQSGVLQRGSKIRQGYKNPHNYTKTSGGERGERNQRVEVS